MTELALDHDQRDALVRHLHGVRVAELVGREPAADPGSDSGVVQLSADSGRSAWAPACRAAQYAEQAADWQVPAELEPGIEVQPGPAVHPDLTPLIALAVTDRQGTAPGVEVGFVESERLADSQPGAPEHDDDPAQPDAVGSLAGGSHHRDDLLDRRRVWRVAKPRVARCSPLVEAGGGRRRPAPAGAIEQ
jgi:hypothetical protein